MPHIETGIDGDETAGRSAERSAERLKALRLERGMTTPEPRCEKQRRVRTLQRRIKRLMAQKLWASRVEP